MTWFPCFALQLACLASVVSSLAAARPPNFIVILVDDLDETQDTGGELAMPATKRLLRDRGVTFTNHLVTTPICCPSRVNLLRGQLSHNTNFTDVLGPHGGYAKFRALGLDREWLPTWLQRGGYNTLYTGKFIVDYTIRNCREPPGGWTAFDALVHPFTFEYYCPAFSLNGGEPRMYPAQYVTDVVAAKAVALLRSAVADPAGRPFYLQVAPPAPHHSMHYDFNSSGAFVARHWYPPLPAARHWEVLSGAALPRPPSFNDPWVGGKPAWLAALPALSAANVTFLEEVFRLRLRSMRAVDELVDALVSELESLGLSGSTYLAFTSDNGYHEGVHRMGSGKTTPYEEDLRVPLLMVGPGLAPGSRVDVTTAHIDIAPTVLALAGLPLPLSLDGTPLPLAAVSDGSLPASYMYGRPDHGPLRNQLVAEFWGEWSDESIHSHTPYPNNTWKAVRVLRSDRQEAYKYVMHCSGEYELYDLVRDPYERINLLAPMGGGAGAGGGLGARRRGLWSSAWTAMSPVLAQLQPSPSPATSSAPHPTAPADVGRDKRGGVGAAAAAAAVARAWARTAWAALGTGATRGSARSAGFMHNSGGGGGGNSSQPRVPPAVGNAAGGARGVDVGTGGGGAGWLRGDYGRWLLRLRSRLDALLAVLAVCGGRGCSQPFQVLHPGGSVSDLWAAMDEQYDELYDAVPPFSFGRCLPYQDVDNERSAFRGAAGMECTAQEPGADDGRRARGGSGEMLGGTTGVGANGRKAYSDGGYGEGDGDSDGERHAIGDRSGGGGGGGFQLMESDVESSAVPLPARYKLVTDVYGNVAAAGADAMLLA